MILKFKNQILKIFIIRKKNKGPPPGKSPCIVYRNNILEAF